MSDLVGNHIVGFPTRRLKKGENQSLRKHTFHLPIDKHIGGPRGRAVKSAVS